VDELIKSYPQTPDLLFCVAGGAKKENGFFVDLQEDQFKACLNNNYFASVFISQACLRLWLAEDEVEQRTKGTRHIVFVSSKAAFVGLPGYTAYTTAKVAVRALADTLRQEVLLYGKDRFKIHCAFPGSYMSEAFLADKVELPELTKILEGIDSDKEELAKKKPSPADMAGLILRAVVRGDFMITTDLQGGLLLNNMRGPSPRDHRLLDLLQSLIVVPIWAFYRRLFDQKTSNYGESLRKSA
jgi:3-dehydrosphinganine reductase